MLPADWYCALKNRAVGVRLDEPQFASVVFDHGKTDSEPHSHAAGFCRKERIEHAFSILDRNSGSGVFGPRAIRSRTISTSSAGCLERLCIRCLDIPSLPRLLLSCVSDIAWGPNTVPLFVPPLSPLGPLCSPKAKGKGEVIAIVGTRVL